MTDTFLLEIGLEEMPDNAIQSAEQQLVEKTKQFLDEHHLKYDDVLGFSTPRRFAVMVKDLEDKQPDENLIVRGPSQKIAQDEEGNWTKAAIGFSKGQGGDVEDLIIKEDNGEPYVFIEKFIPGKESKELLKGLTEVVKNIEFPKLMKWGDNSYHYVRPIHWVLSLLGKQVVPIEVFDIKSSDTTLGHRFLGEKIKINHPSEYEKKLKEQYVIADRQARKEMIINQMNELCKENNWTVPHLHSHLLEEVTDLVEYPTAFYGSFEESYLDIPNIVLETSMIDHQRYFSVWSSDESNLLAYFISVRNGNENHIETVAKGNEKVLSARLADAKFFYDEDKEKSIQEHIEKLKLLDYHEDLGTMYEKQNRVNKMVERMDQYVELSVDEKNNLNRASSIYKFDLVTQMVGEFPNLQGKIGAIYARQQGENEVVSEAIGEQYLPSSAKGELGKSKVAKLLAMADKLDSLIQFFSADIIPTGSNDPYALRRQAMGVVRLILSFDLHKLNLKDFLEDMINVSDLPANRLEQLKENKENLMNFILSRLEQILQSKYEISHDIRQAVFGLEEKNMMKILEHAKILEEAKEKEGFKSFIESITRVLNITQKHGKPGEIIAEEFQTESERKLAKSSEELKALFTTESNSEERYFALNELSPTIDEFFEENMIMVDDAKLKENRLGILNNIAKIAKSYADFNQIIVKKD